MNVTIQLINKTINIFKFFTIEHFNFKSAEKVFHGSVIHTITFWDMLCVIITVDHGNDLLVEQKPQMHWWVNGFNMSDKMYLPESLTLKFTIVMPDEEMLNAFCKSIDNNYNHDVTYSIDRLKISVEW